MHTTSLESMLSSEDGKPTAIYRRDNAHEEKLGAHLIEVLLYRLYCCNRLCSLNSLELPLDIGSQTLVQLLWNGEGYLRRQEGYSVEYLNFAVFSEGVDVIRSMQALKMSTDIEDIYAEMGGVTVYYDWEVDRIFFIGSGLDPALMYGFYCTF